MNQRTIKRYSSRKLYDTVAKAYVTLEDVARMVRAGEDVRILDNGTDEDLTNQYLVQIIAEHESSGASPLPTAVLADLVRLYGEGASALTPDFLTKAVESFAAQGEEAMRRMSEADPTGTVKAVQGWQAAQAKLFTDTFGQAFGASQRRKSQPEPSLEERVAALEAEVARLRDRT